jgi:hypothetical protein
MLLGRAMVPPYTTVFGTEQYGKPIHRLVGRLQYLA